MIYIYIYIYERLLYALKAQSKPKNYKKKKTKKIHKRKPSNILITKEKES